VIFLFTKLIFQFAPPKDLPDATLYHELDDAASEIEYKPHPHNDQAHGKDPSPWGKLLNLIEAHGGQCNDRHIKGVNERPVLYENISHSASQKQQDKEENANHKVGYPAQSQPPLSL
jgi:hypothetical protein